MPAQFDPNLESILATDASKYEVGALLQHEDNDEKDHSPRIKDIIAGGKEL